jgi:hypothetical protein
MDLVPIMGLVSLLIPLLLLGNGVAFGVIEASAPAVCACHGGEGEAFLVPSVGIHPDGLSLTLDAAEPEHFGAADLEGLTARLKEVSDAHATNGRILVVPDGDVAYEGLIAVMDASRPAFPHVTVAGGVL